MNIESIIIDNLKCGGCANTITRQLSAMEGVKRVTVDLATSTILVEKDESVARTELLKKLTQSGYPEVGTTNLMQKAKSYISCATGRLSNG